MLTSIFILTTLVTPPVADQPDSRETAASVMSFFVGSCWEGVFSDGQSTDVHCLRPVYGGKFVRDNHLVEGQRGPYGGETMFAWDAGERRLIYSYWDSSGGMSEGYMVPVENELRSPVEVYNNDEGEMHISSAWRITGPDSWEQITEEVSGDAPKTLWFISYTRADINDGPRPEIGE